MPWQAPWQKECANGWSEDGVRRNDDELKILEMCRKQSFASLFEDDVPCDGPVAELENPVAERLEPSRVVDIGPWRLGISGQAIDQGCANLVRVRGQAGETGTSDVLVLYGVGGLMDGFRRRQGRDQLAQGIGEHLWQVLLLSGAQNAVPGSVICLNEVLSGRGQLVPVRCSPRLLERALILDAAVLVEERIAGLEVPRLDALAGEISHFGGLQHQFLGVARRGRGGGCLGERRGGNCDECGEAKQRRTAAEKVYEGRFSHGGKIAQDALFFAWCEFGSTSPNALR